MPFGDRAWRDSTENYCDPYVIKVNGSTATAVMAQNLSQPVAIYGISVSVNPSVGSGLVDILDSSATANNDPTVWSIVIASATAQDYNYIFPFPRGLACTAGIVVTATTVTGSISLLYKQRYN